MLCDDIRFLTERALWETENFLKCIPDDLWDKRYDGIPVWKYVYHMLYSMDRWYIDPYDPEYRDPPFHFAGANDLNVVPESERIEGGVLLDYFYGIRKKIGDYLDILTDDMLDKCPEGCELSRLRLIIGQIRHWHRHMGIVYGFMIEETGKWPYVLNMNAPKPAHPMPAWYDEE